MADVRKLLTSMGVSNYLATMAIPYMWFRPGTVDPDSPSIIEIIKGAQKGLHSLGYPVTQTGVLDAPTAKALDDLLLKPKGSWMEMPWVDIYSSIAKAKANPERRALHIKAKVPGLGSYFEYDGPPVGPLPGVMVGLPPGPLGLGSSSMDSGVELTYGQGVSNPRNMVGIGSTKSIFQDLQRQLNRLLSVTPNPRKSRIAEDGILGDDSVRALDDIANKVIFISYGIENPAQLAAKANTMRGTLSYEADQRSVGASANKGSTYVPGKSSSTKSVMNKSEATNLANQMPKTAGFSEFLKSPLGLAVLVASGFALYGISQSGKGKKKSKGLLGGWI